jgi:hypothetical protein
MEPEDETIESYIKNTIKINKLKDYYNKIYDDALFADKGPFEELEEEIDENLDLVEFYAKLLIEKIGRLDILGKSGISFDYEVTRISESDMYDIDITIENNINKVSIESSIKMMEELKQLEDDRNNIAVTYKDDIIVSVRVNSDDLQDLDPANKASTKFNL